jgi:hypothetical protein
VSASHLRVVEVDNYSGEVEGVDVKQLVAEVEKLRVDLKMAQRDVKAKNRRISELERNKAQERLDYERRADVERIATYWHRKCRPDDFARETPRVNPMSPERFDAVRGILDQERLVPVEGQRRARREPTYSLEECKAAIDGAAFDHFSKQRRNGSWEHFDDLELIFRSGKHFEGFRDKAPRRVDAG